MNTYILTTRVFPEDVSNLRAGMTIRELRFDDVAGKTYMASLVLEDKDQPSEDDLKVAADLLSEAFSYIYTQVDVAHAKRKGLDVDAWVDEARAFLYRVKPDAIRAIR